VEKLLEIIATSESPRYHALIDTEALVTGYSYKDVVKQLLDPDRRLSWCEGVVFFDDEDRQQVLADQCRLSLVKRFAFYDQIHANFV